MLRRSPIFWVSVTLIAIFVLMAIWPSLFTSTDPRAVGDVRTRPGGDAIFGRDGQGYDIYARTIYGARASILVGVLATTAVTLFGGFFGMISGYFAGWSDTVISRITDVFFAIPLILGGILFMTAFPSDQSTPYLWVVMKVVIVLSMLAWPGVLRLMRGSVLQVKHNEYVLAARALGAGTSRILWRHILPNAVTPVLTLTTINVGCVHRGRGHVVVPRDRPGAARRELGCRDRRGPAVRLRLPAHVAVPQPVPEPVCACVHHARRVRAGRVRPQVPMTNPDSRTEREGGR